MYDAGKSFLDWLSFVLLFISPIWYNAASARAAEMPALPKAASSPCIRSVEYMRSSHMDILEAWREQVVREGNHTWVASDGKSYDISLVGTCMSCHTSKEEFCGTCHTYTGVDPNCWTCHVAPEVTKK